MKSVESGKKIVITIIIILLICVFEGISTIVNSQTDDKVSSGLFQLARFVIIGSFLYYLYEGKELAKGLIVIISFANVLRLLSSFILLFTNIGLLVINLINMVIGISLIAIAVTLIVSRPVNDFLRFQRGEFEEESNKEQLSPR